VEAAMQIELDYVLGSIDTVRKLTAKVRKQAEEMPDVLNKEKTLLMIIGQDAGLDGVLKLLEIHPDCGKQVSEWVPPSPKLPRRSTEEIPKGSRACRFRYIRNKERPTPWKFVLILSSPTRSARNSSRKRQFYTLRTAAPVFPILGACGMAALVTDVPAVQVGDHRSEFKL
jgi:hypothetical protein